MSNLNYTEAGWRESHGGYGAIGIRVGIAVGHALTEAEQRAVNRAMDRIFDELLAGSMQSNPEAMAEAASERRAILGLFDTPIFVEEIPNEYCSAGCCRHRPWFLVTTRIGRIKIGWRKRVIVIDWSASTVTRRAESLFPDRDTTMFDRGLHAWGYEDAGRCLSAILAAVP